MNYSIGPGLYPGIVYFCKRCGQRRIIKAENYQPMIWDDEVPSSLASPVDVN